LHTLLPEAATVGVKESTPAGLSCGAALNSALLLHTTAKLTVWPASPGPAEMLLAQALLNAPELSATVMLLSPLVKEGASFTAKQKGTTQIRLWYQVKIGQNTHAQILIRLPDAHRFHRARQLTLVCMCAR
jgi:hypothetical protein